MDEDIQVKYGGTNEGLCSVVGERPREGCWVERIIDIQVKQGENGLESCFSELGCERKRG